MKTRRDFIATTIAAAVSLGSSGQIAGSSRKTNEGLQAASRTGKESLDSVGGNLMSLDAKANTTGNDKKDKAEDPRITRARLSGPEQVTRNATVAEFGPDGAMTVLVKGTNEWVCVPGDENKIGVPPMCMNPMGMQWMMDAMQGKPKPTNAAPGMIYMLCGATQRSNTDARDKTSPAIPIGPHWMITWPFDAAANGLPTTVRDKGAWVMFAGTPYAYLHVCGSPWEGTEYHEGDKAVWTMSYSRP
jgi:hypothetical protein